MSTISCGLFVVLRTMPYLALPNTTCNTHAHMNSCKCLYSDTTRYKATWPQSTRQTWDKTGRRKAVQPIVTSPFCTPCTKLQGQHNTPKRHNSNRLGTTCRGDNLPVRGKTSREPKRPQHVCVHPNLPGSPHEASRTGSHGKQPLYSEELRARSVQRFPETYVR